MSWDSYIDNLLGHTGGHGDKACIIGKDGSQWTTSANPKNINLSAAEAATIASTMKGGEKTGEYSTFQASGIHAEGVKYQFLRGDENLALGKKKDLGAITLQCSKTAIVIGHTKEGGSQGSVNKGVAVIAEYLDSLGM